MDNAIVHMYERLPDLVLGFHGCSKETMETLVCKNGSMKNSRNKYDWLGNGMYFWENSYQRAYDWARNKYDESDASVVGAVICLGRCLNLTDYHSSDILRRGYEMLEARCNAVGKDMPSNGKKNKNGDVLLRDLDCAVIQQIHDYHRQQNLPAYDSVRGIFVEGGVAYPGAEFQEKTHIQLCVVNPNCIKGFFIPRMPDEKYTIV